MRFLSSGPSIPDELLVACDEGRVVFFCGAGVSRARAGLSDFYELTEKVIEVLVGLDDSPAKRLIGAARSVREEFGISSLVSADRVFGLLEQDFSSRDIWSAVANSLRPPPNVDLSAHRIMLDLARGTDGQIRLVTTNFDRLFELCDTQVPCVKPSNLPNLSRSEKLTGIIHLHGVVNTTYSGADGDSLVLSSSEFGRAYLSEGWATAFIQSILSMYSVVFVGYAADDPPVQYLLEALHRAGGYKNSLYAFQVGTESEAHARWNSKGVQAIAYDERDGHKRLWDSLSAWANRIRSRDAWFDNVIAMSRNGPATLSPFERGQVAHIVSTLEGARRFASADPIPPAEWLCVFDASVRFSRPIQTFNSGEDGKPLDPFKVYGLDSDPAPAAIDPTDSFAKREVPANVWDCFTLNRLDRSNLGEGSLPAFRGHWANNVPNLAPRLAVLGIWFKSNAHEPAAVWWAAKQSGIHPNIQSQLAYWLERVDNKVPPVIRLAWNYILTAWREKRRESDLESFHLKASIERLGWSAITVHKVAGLYRPFLNVRTSFYLANPPTKGDGVELNDLLNLEIEYPEISSEILIPSEFLLPYVRELRKVLELAVVLESEIGGYGPQNLCAIEMEVPKEGESTERTYGLSRILLHFVEMMKLLISKSPESMKAEYLSWWTDDAYLFARLRIWICGERAVLSGSEAGEVLAGLKDEVFWNARNQRDLLLVLSKRWKDFDQKFQFSLGEKILQGRSQWKTEEQENYVQRKAALTLSWIHWLRDHGCSFQFDFATEEERLRRQCPQWTPDRAQKIVDSLEGRAGWVRTETDFSALLHIPLEAVIDRAVELASERPNVLVENDPFSGLARNRPIRALGALASASRKGRNTDWAWTTFLSPDRRKSDSARLRCLVAGRVSKLPTEMFKRLIRPITDWCLSIDEYFWASGIVYFERLWSGSVSSLQGESGQSALVRKKSAAPDWATEALNSPAGKLAQLLVKMPAWKELKANGGMPPQWIVRANELLTLPNDGARYALVMLAFSLNWIFFVDPNWARQKILVELKSSGQNRDAVWSGFFWAAQIPSISLFLELKPHLLRLAVENSTLKRTHMQVFVGMLLGGWLSIHEETGVRTISNSEMKTLLANGTDELRGQILWQWQSWLRQGANRERLSRELVGFLGEVWPRQTKAKSPRVSARLCDLVFLDIQIFPTIVDLVVPLLAETEGEHMFFPTAGNTQESIFDKYPEKTLEVLWAVLPKDASLWPFDIEKTISRINSASTSIGKDPRLVEIRRRWDAR